MAYPAYMDSWTDEVFAIAKRLPRDARLRLAEQLRSYQPVEEPPVLSDAWRAEIAKRLAKLEDGSAVLIDGDEHLRRLRSKFGDF